MVFGAGICVWKGPGGSGLRQPIFSGRDEDERGVERAISEVIQALSLWSWRKVCALLLPLDRAESEESAETKKERGDLPGVWVCSKVHIGGRV